MAEEKMKHFIVEIIYTAPPARIDEVLGEHRAFLQEGYDTGLLLMSGPQVTKTGGMVVARAENKEELEAYFRRDPYHLYGVAEHRVVEFQPVKLQAFMKDWVG
jgi:uncharacterized protein YciI